MTKAEGGELTDVPAVGQSAFRSYRLAVRGQEGAAKRMFPRVCHPKAWTCTSTSMLAAMVAMAVQQ
jgi:hypothetical protein